MIEETVPAALAGERVDRAVSFLTGCTRSEAAELVSNGAVRLNARRVKKGSARLSEGDLIAFDETTIRQEVVPAPEPDIELDIRHMDEHVMVVHKPAGLVVHPGAGTPVGTLVNALLAHDPGIASVGDVQRPGIVHRLDKGTSGLLMVARTQEALESLVGQLSDRTVERRYLAVVWRHIENDRGMVEAPIGRHKRHATKMAVVADGKEARTHYEVERRADEPAEVSVLRCRLETGRTHQIRVHLSAIEHPVVGDALYGGRRDAISFSRPALHAGVLGFTHPVSGDRLRFEAEPPLDLKELLATLH